MDKIDLMLVNELQKDAERSIYQLSKYLGLKRSTVYNRIKKLKQEGVIKRHHAVVDYEKIGLPFCSFILVRIKKSVKTEVVCEEISKDSAVEEIHPITGSFDLILKARFKDIKGLSHFTLKRLSRPVLANKILRTETMITLDTYKEYFKNV